MKIAVPTNDGTSLSEHFGRSAGFLVFEIDGGKIQNCEMRRNVAQHSHDPGGCAHGPQGHEAHSHAGIVSCLAGCDIVICGGMGRQAADALRSAGVTPVVAGFRGAAEGAVKAYLNGELRPAAEGFCRCSH